MYCPKCGADIADNHSCEKCGWNENDVNIEDVQNPDESTETQVDLNSLENINVDFNEVNSIDVEKEDEANFSNDDLSVDFETIDNNTEKNLDKKTKSGSTIVVSIVSFIAGVLATLVVISCLNGTVINYFDKFTNGTPYEVIENFCKSNFETNDAKVFTKTSSPYYRAQIASAIKQQSTYYGQEVDVNLDCDVTKDSEFEKVADYFMKNYVVSDTQKMVINKIDFKNIEYYKSDSDDFKTYLNEYKASSNEKVAKAEGVSLFAKVSCSISYTVKTVQQETTTAQTTTTTAKADKTKKSDETQTETTTEAPTETTQAPTTKVEKKDLKEDCTIVCVKINKDWYVYNGISSDAN